jgi:hypothetical protein
LESADIITLFVSSDFLASDYCYEKEVRHAMRRQAQKDALIVPILVRSCDWSDAPFGHLKAIPTNGLPVTKWKDRDEAWTDVAINLKYTVIEALNRIVTKLEQQQQMDRWQLLLEAQKKIFEIQQDVTAAKAATQDAAFKRWEEYLHYA